MIPKTALARASRFLASAVLASGIGLSVEALAPVPPMGWNSWDSYGTTVRENQVKSNADILAAKLARYGWRYIVVDIQWYEPNAQGHDYRPGAKLVTDEFGRLTPAVNRFPSAENAKGFKPLADYVHSKGLKLGIHIMRGVPRQAVEANTPIWHSNHRAGEIADRHHICDWNSDMYGVDMSKPGAQDYYDSIAALYASWGVDFIKADDMSRPYDLRRPEVVALSAAIRKTGRAMVLSLSPGPAPVARADDLREHAQMWRISDDFWDDWKLLKKQFDYARDWAPYVGRDGTWPDADMLPLGKLRVADAGRGPQDSKFTPDEQQTLMTLWAIFRSPLIVGGDLPSSDEKTLALLTNADVLAIDQHSSNNRQVLEQDDIRGWTATTDKAGATKYVALFNTGEQMKRIRLKWPDLGLSIAKAPLRDIWQKKDLGSREGVDVALRPHASVLYRISSGS